MPDELENSESTGESSGFSLMRETGDCAVVGEWPMTYTTNMAGVDMPVTGENTIVAWSAYVGDVTRMDTERINEMKLWILKPRDVYLRDEPNPDNPWQPWYDKCFGMIIRAPNEDTARNMAETKRGDEFQGSWLNPEKSTCEEISLEGMPEIIMRDVAHA